MFEKIKEEIDFIRIYYLHITNYYNYDELKQNCFEILLYINNTNSISDNEKECLRDFVFRTYDDIISIWKYDTISKGDF